MAILTNLLGLSILLAFGIYVWSGIKKQTPKETIIEIKELIKSIGQ